MKNYFLVRPRRFGKSLLCSTLANLFGGKSKEVLFKDLWIGRSGVWDFEKEEHPVIHLDMSNAAGENLNVVDFEKDVKYMLEEIAISAGVQLRINENNIKQCLKILINMLKAKYKKPVVVIIDEYDKPILNLINEPTEMEAVRKSLQSFYSVLKPQEANLRLVFITGLYKFTEMSMFSTLNNLLDISLKFPAGTLVGYTESEIKEYFHDHIQAFKAKLNITDDDILMNELRERYNGYKFGLDMGDGKVSEPIYNPFAINHVFEFLEFIDEWNSSGSASILSKKLIEHGYRYESQLTTSAEELTSPCNSNDMSLTSLMYYGGYATIDKYDKETNKVVLKIPNKSINKYLARDYLKSKFSISSITEFERVAKEVHDVMILTPISEMGSSIEEITKSFDSVLNHFTYDVMNSEAAFRNIIDSVFKIGFHNVAHESHTKNGRMDTKIIEKARIFIIEYKYLEEASKALKQIRAKEYYAKYLSMNLPILLLGISLMIDEESKNRYIDIRYDSI